MALRAFLGRHRLTASLVGIVVSCGTSNPNGYFYRARGLVPTAAGTAANPLQNAVRIVADVMGAHAEIWFTVTATSTTVRVP